MKKTQMIHSPRTFKIGLGLMLAASLASMPVLTGASARQDAKAAAASKKRSTMEKEAAERKASGKKKTEANTASGGSEPSKGKSKNNSKGKAKSTGAEDRARERIGKLEHEAQKIAEQLSPSQKKKLLALINESEIGELATIRGIGKSRGAAIEKARPIESIEDLPKVKGIGLKTFADVVEHGTGTTTDTGGTNTPQPNKANSKSRRSEAGGKGATTREKTRSKKA